VFEYTSGAPGAAAHVRELTAADADVEWTVHLANRKAVAPEFPKGGRRNTGKPAADLVVDGGAQTVRGISQKMKRVHGRFMNVAVPLGDLLTDGAGHLIVLGGFGHSQSVPAGLAIADFANNDGWCDDISDGPVQATIRLKGSAHAVDADPAWVVVAPPDFAPPIENVVTLYDVMYDTMARLVDPSLRVTAATKVSFTTDIYPLLRRVSRMHWVSAVADAGHGAGSFGDFAAAVATLASNQPAGKQLRSMIFGRLRNPKGGGGDMPKLPEDTNPDMVGESVTETQFLRMERWAQGTFEADWPGAEPAPLPLDQIPEAERPKALDRAALESCVGGPFFPGIEMGRIILEASTCDKARPFRINPHLEPGALTARMAVPWQADFHDCAFEDGADWWPGQRPIQIVRRGRRADWMPENWTRENLVERWSRLGFVVEKKKGTKTTYVEAERSPGLKIPSIRPRAGRARQT
jgi:hypothetical protein